MKSYDEIEKAYADMVADSKISDRLRKMCIRDSYGCAYGMGRRCIGVCYKELLAERRKHA